MLSRALREHVATSTALRAERDRLRIDATDALADVTDALTETLNIRVAQAFQNQKDIEAEAKKLQSSAARYQKQTKQWLSLVNQLNSALKELGDAENWGKAIERDIKEITEVLVRPPSAGGDPARTFPQSPGMVTKSLRRSIYYIVGINLIFIVKHFTIPEPPPIIIDFFGQNCFIALMQIVRALIIHSTSQSGSKWRSLSFRSVPPRLSSTSRQSSQGSFRPSTARHSRTASAHFTGLSESVSRSEVSGVGLLPPSVTTRLPARSVVEDGSEMRGMGGGGGGPGLMDLNGLMGGEEDPPQASDFAGDYEDHEKTNSEDPFAIVSVVEVNVNLASLLWRASSTRVGATVKGSGSAVASFSSPSLLPSPSPASASSPSASSVRAMGMRASSPLAMVTASSSSLPQEP
ncbi:GCN5-like protein 1-domain-containing protein [Chytridium lagenaria]|nr:GCN5-like protein 1-domain-containing protein [Chytridium lagenaria]